MARMRDFKIVAAPHEPEATPLPSLSSPSDGEEREGRGVVQGFKARSLLRGILSPVEAERMLFLRQREIIRALIISICLPGDLHEQVVDKRARAEA